MTKKSFLEEALKNGGITGRIYTSVKDMKRDQGSHYGAVLRASDVPARTKPKRIFTDEEGVTKLRRRYYDCETVYNVVITDTTEEGAEKILEGFLLEIAGSGDGYYDDDGNWVGCTVKATDWVDEEDSVLKSKVAVQAEVHFLYGIYRDLETARITGTNMCVVLEGTDGGQQNEQYGGL